MKLALVSIFSLFVAAQSFGATATCSKLDILGFVACEIPASDSDGTDFTIMDETDASLDFVFEKTVGKTAIYKEMNGKCEISVENISMDFNQKNAKQDSMLTLDASVVKVTKGTGCVLKGKHEKELRSVTGVYVD